MPRAEAWEKEGTVREHCHDKSQGNSVTLGWREEDQAKQRCSVFCRPQRSHLQLLRGEDQEP